jgi:hypothetical protein
LFAALSASQQTLTSGLWRTDKGFVSTMAIKNVLAKSAVTLTPTLYMADGTAVTLPAIRLAPNASTTINVNRALASTRGEKSDHLTSFGSASLKYTGNPTDIIGSMSLVSARLSLSYVSQMEVLMNQPGSPQTLEGLWWRRDAGVGGFLGVSNSTAESKSVALRAIDTDGSESPVETISLNPHETRILKLESFFERLHDEDARVGGLRVQFSGQIGDVNVMGGLENTFEGYSAVMPFWMAPMKSTSSVLGTVTLTHAGIMVGKADPMMNFPAGTAFTPYLALRNTIAAPVDLQIMAYRADGTATALPIPPLKAYEARQLDFAAALSQTPLNGFSGMLNLSVSHVGQATDVLEAAGSVDASGTYVFEVPAKTAATSLSKDTPYWTVAGGTDTMVSLWNTSGRAQDLTFTVVDQAGTGTYQFPLHLDAHAAYNLNMGELIMSQKRDIAGHFIPPGTVAGSLRFADAKGYTTPLQLTANVGVFNVSTATCYYGCIYCNGWNSLHTSPSGVSIPAGQTAEMQALAYDAYNEEQGVGANWSSSNTSVATTSNNGSIVTINARFPPAVQR